MATAPGSVPVRDAWTPWHVQILSVLVRRRIFLSNLLFVAAGVLALVRQVRPLDPTDVLRPIVAGGLVCLLSGLLLRTWAVGILRKHQQLTVTGPYRLIRNPLYLGSFLMAGGLCLLVGDPWVAAMVVAGMAVLYGLKIRSEERLLAQSFGQDYVAYARRTPRLIPWRWTTQLAADWRFRQWLISREYQAWLAAALVLAAMTAWARLS